LIPSKASARPISNPARFFDPNDPKVSDDEIWRLTVYGKSERATIPDHILKQIAEEIKDV